VSIEVLNETDWEIEPTEFVSLARYVLSTLNVHPQADVAITFVDLATMSSLHERWLDLPGPTDVLSFPMDEIRPGSEDEPSAEGILGDVIISPDVAARQARELGHSATEEMLLLTTHGLLHLLGFDHAEPAEQREMFTLQRRLLLTYLSEHPAPDAAADQVPASEWVPTWGKATASGGGAERSGAERSDAEGDGTATAGTASDIGRPGQAGESRRFFEGGPTGFGDVPAPGDGPASGADRPGGR
jgi:probable rRNA maturation factor